MELAQLRMVQQIQETGSLCETARRLSCAQSVVSRQLAAFERECGGRIFDRDARGARLTPFGRQVLPQIEKIVTAERSIAAAGARMRSEASGEVKVAVSPQAARCLSGPLFAELKRRHPTIRLTLSEAFSGGIRRNIEEGRTDIAVFMRIGAPASREERVICDLQTFLVGLPDSAATSSSAIAFSALADVPLLLPSPPSVWRRTIEEAAASKGVDLSIAAEVNDPGPTTALVYSGAGYLLAPLATGAAAAHMGWLGADVRTNRLRASRIIDPGFVCKLVVSTGVNRRQRVYTVAKLIESILGERLKDGDAPPKGRD